MNKLIHLLQFVFDEKETAEKAKPIIEGILKARSPPIFAPEYPKAGFRNIETDFLVVEKVNKGHGHLEKRTLTPVKCSTPIRLGQA